MRVLRPADGIVAFYDGRVEGYRFAEDRMTLDVGRLRLELIHSTSTATTPP